MELDSYRKQIDLLDEKLLALFRERMELAARIGEYKQAHGLPVCDPVREQQKLSALESPAERMLMEKLMELSKGRQEQAL